MKGKPGLINLIKTVDKQIKWHYDYSIIKFE